MRLGEKHITWNFQLTEHGEVLFLKKEQKGMGGKRKSRHGPEKLPLESRWWTETARFSPTCSSCYYNFLKWQLYWDVVCLFNVGFQGAFRSPHCCVTTFQGMVNTLKIPSVHYQPLLLSRPSAFWLINMFHMDVLQCGFISWCLLSLSMLSF